LLKIEEGGKKKKKKKILTSAACNGVRFFFAHVCHKLTSTLGKAQHRSVHVYTTAKSSCTTKLGNLLAQKDE